MRFFIKSLQVLVGLLFLVSGLVKANDPLGLSYKMQEFFELWHSELAASHFVMRSLLIDLFQWGHEHSLFISIAMITLETGAGIALWTGWKRKPVLWLLLVLILFFTFLTAYAYYSGKFTNCGCFGDCLPISPFTSFVKDLILLVAIILLLLFQKYLFRMASSRRPLQITAVALVATILFQWYVLNYLPLADCLPFKKGNNIAAQMKPAPGSVPDSFEIRFLYKKNGRNYEFTPDQLPADFETYTYIDRKDRLIRKGNADPAIKGFALTGLSGADSTEAFLAAPRALALFVQQPREEAWVKDFIRISKEAQAKKIPVFLITSEASKAAQLFSKALLPDLQIFTCDFTVLRTAARTDPTLYLIEKATIRNKFGKRQLNGATPYLQ